MGVLPSSIVIVRKQKHSGTAQELRVLWFPFLSTAGAARSRNAPRPKQINLCFAFDDQNRLTSGDRL
jgi:hypothetical protein